MSFGINALTGRIKYFSSNTEKKKIKIIYITYMGLTEPLLHSQVLNYLKGLSRKGVSICILSFEKKQFLSEGGLRQINQELGRYGIKWFYLIYHKRLQFLSKPYDILKGMFFVFWFSFTNGIDLIHGRGMMGALIGILPAIVLKKKIIFDLRGLMAEEYVDAELWRRNSLFYKIGNRLEIYLMRKSHGLVVLTNKAKDLLVKRYKVNNSISIIPTCVDLDKFKIKEITNLPVGRYALDGKTVLVYSGSIGTWYMLPEMMNFYEELFYSWPNCIFLILSQSEQGPIQRCIDQKLRDNVIIDFVNPDKVADFLMLADIGIFFIKPCFSKTVSCPTKFAEYLACGLPVVINKGIGDTEEIVRENRIGVIVEDFTREEYGHKITQLKKLLQEGEGLKSRCRKVSERYFSLGEGVEKYFQLYSNLTK